MTALTIDEIDRLIERENRSRPQPRGVEKTPERSAPPPKKPPVKSKQIRNSTWPKVWCTSDNIDLEWRG